MIRTSRLASGVLALLIAGGVGAQANYPEKPVRMVVGFPPGGPADTVARLLGQRFAEALGKPIVVYNAIGAGGNIATERVAKAAPDGYTLAMVVEAQIVINPRLYSLPFDPVKDFSPVSQVTVSPYILVVNNEVLAQGVQQLVALAKARPGGLTFASAGVGSSPHMAGELFKSVAGINMQHVPYKGVAPAVPDLLGGRVTMMFSPIGTVLPLARGGKLRALAVTSAGRFSAAPEVPTIAESGYPGFEVTGWLGLVAPAGSPARVIRKLNDETVKALALPQLRVRLAELGLEGIGSSPDEFAAVIRSGIPKWAKVIEESGIKAN